MSAPFSLLSYLARPRLRGGSALGRAVAGVVPLPTIAALHVCADMGAHTARKRARALSRVYKSLSLGGE